ncbi:MAG: tRNA (adenosine(37)-N6)-threonylcarbamoyltransferase complex ATPase subunit type 1 TsaE [Nocardioides sp.]
MSTRTDPMTGPDHRPRKDSATTPAPVAVRHVGPEAALEVLSVIKAAFGVRPRLDPPADADGETVQTVARALAAQGGLLAEFNRRPIGTLILDQVDDRMFLRRFAVVPDLQGTGVAGLLTDRALIEAAECRAVAVVAREELPDSVGFWRRQGFRQVRSDPPYLELERTLTASSNPTREAVDADAMRALGSALAGFLAPGDVIVLNGELGAGKTTFTQGVGAGLGVRGEVTSPTFVIARIHPSLGSGPALVHVDAYRLGGFAELDDLDLEASVDRAVTVVEWGGGIAEGLAPSRLEITLARSVGGDPGPEAPAGDPTDPRSVEIRPVGPRWSHVDWSRLP